MRAQTLEAYFRNPSAIAGSSVGPWGGVHAGTIRRVTVGETGLSGVRTFVAGAEAAG